MNAYNVFQIVQPVLIPQVVLFVMINSIMIIHLVFPVIIIVNHVRIIPIFVLHALILIINS